MFMSRVAALVAFSLAFTTSAAAQPAAVTVAVWSFNFSPKPIHLAAGKPVTLDLCEPVGWRPRFHGEEILRQFADPVGVGAKRRDRPDR